MKLADISSVVGCSPSKLSRIESGQSSFSLEEWYLFTEYFELPYDCVRTGFIEKTFCDDLESFQIPSPYKDNAYTGGRVANYYIRCFRKFFGEKLWTQFCECEKINPSYFVNLENKISMKFTTRLAQELVRNGVLNTKEKIYNATKIFTAEQSFHGRFSQDYKGLSALTKAKSLISNMINYENNHFYGVEDFDEDKQTLTYSFSPREHVSMKVWRDDLLLERFFFYWIVGSMLNFAGLDLKNFNVKSNIHCGDDRCVIAMMK